MIENNYIKERAALVSVGVKTLLAIAKLVAGLMSGSLALLSEAANNIGDIAIVCFSFVAIRIANKPADDTHHYGHAKVETLAALAQTGFLLGLAVYIFATAVNRLMIGYVNVVPGALSFGVLVVSIIVDISRWYSLNKIAKKTRSEALAADALNFASDIVASTFALLGLLAVHFGFWQGDSIGALGVAVFIAIAGFNLARRTINALTDAAPPGLTESISAAALRVPGVIAVDSLRLRPVGPNVLGDISIRVPRTLPQDGVTAIKGNVSAAIAATHPDVELTVETTPVALDDESVVERLLLIAAKRHVAIHHVIVQQVCGKIALSCDIEVDGTMPLGQAHSIASGLEAEARKELGPDIEIDTHIEPLEPRELAGEDAPGETRVAIANALSAAASDGIEDIHNVRARKTASGLVVNYHCRADPRASVAAVHQAVDALEHRVREEFPAIARLVGHAEPLR
ncbi:MAG TPA: cation diffusion facilitator family transporter [Methylovirgula sp.]